MVRCCFYGPNLLRFLDLFGLLPSNHLCALSSPRTAVDVVVWVQRNGALLGQGRQLSRCVFLPWRHAVLGLVLIGIERDWHFRRWLSFVPRLVRFRRWPIGKDESKCSLAAFPPCCVILTSQLRCHHVLAEVLILSFELRLLRLQCLRHLGRDSLVALHPFLFVVIAEFLDPACGLPRSSFHLCGIELVLLFDPLLQLLQDAALPAKNVAHVRFAICVCLAPLHALV